MKSRRCAVVSVLSVLAAVTVALVAGSARGAAGAWAQSSTMSFSHNGDTLTWRFGTGDIGGAGGFNFTVLSAIYDAEENVVAMDAAPDGGVWAYDLSRPAVTPVIGRPTAVPAAPIAGKRVTVRFPVTRSDNGAPLTAGTMACDPRVNGKMLKHAESFRGGTATLVLQVPRAVKGKQLKIKLTVK